MTQSSTCCENFVLFTLDPPVINNNFLFKRSIQPAFVYCQHAVKVKPVITEGGADRDTEGDQVARRR